MCKLLLLVGFLALLAVGYSDPKCQYKLVNNNTNDSCAIVNATITLNYYYINYEGNNVSRVYNLTCPDGGDLYVPECSDHVTMKLNLDSDMVLLTFEFMEASKRWNMSKVSAVLEDSDYFFNSTIDEPVEGVITDAVSGDVNSEMSYMCNTNRTFYMTTNTTNVTMSMFFSDLRVQAFDFGDKNNEFGSAHRCSSDIKGSKIVPIAVGAALAGLVIIVLIAYIIGRLRSRRQSSYEALS